jgi:hypothetical protein
LLDRSTHFDLPFDLSRWATVVRSIRKAGKRAVAAFFSQFAPWHANARYYSLFRREALADSGVLRGADYLASDWAVVLE